MELLITPTGDCRCVYDELLDLRDLGPLTIHVHHLDGAGVVALAGLA